MQCAAVEDNPESQRKTQHDRHLRRAEEEQVRDPSPEIRVDSDAKVVGEPDELPSAHQRVAEHAGVERIDEGSDKERGEQQQERRQQRDMGRSRRENVAFSSMAASGSRHCLDRRRARSAIVVAVRRCQGLGHWRSAIRAFRSSR